MVPCHWVTDAHLRDSMLVRSSRVEQSKQWTLQILKMKPTCCLKTWGTHHPTPVYYISEKDYNTKYVTLQQLPWFHKCCHFCHMTVHPTTCHNGSEVGVEVQFYSLFNLGANWGGWLMPRPGHFTPGNNLVISVAGWVPGLVWTGAKNFITTGLSSL